MTFWQIIALIFLAMFVAINLIGVLILKRELRKENAINQARLEQEQYWHDTEEENWRHVDPALQARIKELEATCRRNQNTIAGLEYELLCKDEFLRKFKLKDLYELKGGFIFHEEEL